MIHGVLTKMSLPPAASYLFFLSSFRLTT